MEKEIKFDEDTRGEYSNLADVIFKDAEHIVISEVKRFGIVSYLCWGKIDYVRCCDSKWCPLCGGDSIPTVRSIGVTTDLEGKVVSVKGRDSDDVGAH